MYHFGKKTLKNLEIFIRKKWAFFEKVTRKSNAPVQIIYIFKWLKGSMSLVQRLFFFFFLIIWKFLCFFGKDLEILNFFFEIFFFLISFWKYIHEQSTSNATWIFRIQRNIEIWNKLTKFKLNHDIANQMWSETKLGHLLLLGPFRMLETRYAWTLIMIKCLGLALGRLELTLHACILWTFGPWCWSCKYTFDGLKYWA